MEKFFNIAGPCNPTQHYMVLALERLPEVSRLVSRGQPWLVNAIGAKCVEDIHKFDYSKPITKADVEEAKEVIVRENPVHIDYLFEVIAKPGRALSPRAPNPEHAAVSAKPPYQFHDNGRGFAISSFEMMHHPRVSPLFKAIRHGKPQEEEKNTEGFEFIRDIGVFQARGSKFEFANPIYAKYFESMEAQF